MWHQSFRSWTATLTLAASVSLCALAAPSFTLMPVDAPGLQTANFAWADVDHDSWPDIIGNLKWIQNVQGTNFLFRSMTQGTTVTGSMQLLDAEADGWVDFAVTGSTNRQVNGAYTDLLLNDGTAHLTRSPPCFGSK